MVALFSGTGSEVALLVSCCFNFFPVPGKMSHFWSFFSFFFFFFSALFLRFCPKTFAKKERTKSEKQATKSATFYLAPETKRGKQRPKVRQKVDPPSKARQKARQKARLSCSIFACSFVCLIFGFMIAFVFLGASCDCFFFLLHVSCFCVFSRMRSEGFSFNSWGSGGRALFATRCFYVRNRPQPFATVRNRPQ